MFCMFIINPIINIFCGHSTSLLITPVSSQRLAIVLLRKVSYMTALSLTKFLGREVLLWLMYCFNQNLVFFLSLLLFSKWFALSHCLLRVEVNEHFFYMEKSTYIYIMLHNLMFSLDTLWLVKNI